jgi:hypothetical protein
MNVTILSPEDGDSMFLRNLYLRVFFFQNDIVIRAMCADITEVKTTNLKGSAKQEDESSPPPA